MASDPLKNDLLAKLDKQAFGAIEPHLKTVQLNLGYALAETHAPRSTRLLSSWRHYLLRGRTSRRRRD